MGLADHHAYAVLELKEVDGLKFMLILNPWGHTRWKGRFSVDDSSWTPRLKKELGFHLFEEKDKGAFWMLYEDAVANFGSLELNWNPDMLKHKGTRFGHWKKSDLTTGYENIS